MANGIEMMLKSFGIDTEELKKAVTMHQQMTETIGQICLAVNMINARLERIELALNISVDTATNGEDHSVKRLTSQ